MYDVFISHAPEDADVAHMLADQLQLRGNSVWWQRPLSPDIAFITEHEQNLAAAKWVIALWSRYSTRSEWVLFEAHEARSRGNLISIHLDDEPIPEAFSDTNIPELRAFQSQLDQLIQDSGKQTRSPDLGQLQQQFSTPASETVDSPLPQVTDEEDLAWEPPPADQIRAAPFSLPGDGYANGENGVDAPADYFAPSDAPDTENYAPFEEAIDHHGVSGGFNSGDLSDYSQAREPRIKGLGLIAGLVFIALAGAGGYYVLSGPAPTSDLSSEGQTSKTPDVSATGEKTNTASIKSPKPAPSKISTAVKSAPIQPADRKIEPGRPPSKKNLAQNAPNVLAAVPDAAEPSGSNEIVIPPTQGEESAGVSSDFVEDDGSDLVMLNEADSKTPTPQAEAIAGDARRGEKFVRKCKACHTLKKNGGNKMGPNLFNVLGRGIGAYPGFAYSSALKNHGGGWSRNLLDCYLNNPKRCIKGTTMAFPGLRDQQARADVISYLRELSE